MGEGFRRVRKAPRAKSLQEYDPHYGEENGAASRRGCRMSEPNEREEMIVERVTFYQDNDCCQVDDEGQTLIVMRHHNGSGVFYTLETKRWAFSCVDEIVKTLERCRCRAQDNDEDLFYEARK